MKDKHHTPGAFLRFFSVLNENLWELVQLNLVFLLTCIPIFTFGPSLAALTACLSDMLHKRRRDERILPRYFAAFRTCFLPALPWGLVLLAGSFILGFALYWYGSLAMASWFYVPFMSLSLLGLIFFLGIFIHLFFLLAEKKHVQLKEAAAHALSTMKQTLVCMIIAFFLIAFQILLLPATVPLILTLGLSVPGLALMSACIPPSALQ